MSLQFDAMWRPKVIILGGSAGSFRVVTQILSGLSPETFDIPIVMCLHRLKTVRHGFAEALNFSSRIPVEEPFDKDPVRTGHIYLAPANYHLSLELGKTFALSMEEMVNNSRPAIDLLFESGAYVYRHHALGIILSGANKDGARGMQAVHRMGGQCIVQDPATAEILTMPNSALATTPSSHVMNVEEIVECLNYLPSLPIKDVRKVNMLAG